jgi:hypothetical protein
MPLGAWRIAANSAVLASTKRPSPPARSNTAKAVVRFSATGDCPQAHVIVVKSAVHSSREKFFTKGIPMSFKRSI